MIFKDCIKQILTFICFSFGNNLREYCYARELEPYKRALHYAIFWKDIAPWRELYPETADALKKAVESEQDRHKRRIGAGRAIVTALKAGLMNGTIDPAVMDKPIYRKIRKEKTPGLRIKSAESVERLKSLETLENDERLQRWKMMKDCSVWKAWKVLKRYRLINHFADCKAWKDLNA